MKVLITGGLGFIGLNFARFLKLKRIKFDIVDMKEKVNPAIISSFDCEEWAENVHQIDLGFQDLSRFRGHGHTDIVHFAAESHVDNSITGPIRSVANNIMSTMTVLEFAKKQGARVIQISTDEVYGDADGRGPFTEDDPHRPSSPYSASKAACEDLVRSYRRTYGIRAVILNCVNNYGPFQQEKLIPVVMRSLFRKERIPMYGNGSHMREWIHVFDFCNAIHKVLESDVEFNQFLIGTNDHWANIRMIEHIIAQYSVLTGNYQHRGPESVEDRPGHDWKYWVNFNKFRSAFRWEPSYTVLDSMREVVKWYINNPEFVCVR